MKTQREYIIEDLEEQYRIAGMSGDHSSNGYSIRNSEGRTGRAWSAVYGSLTEAENALKRAMGWDTIYISGSYQGDRVTAWSAYENSAAMQADQDGADAPRIELADRP